MTACNPIRLSSSRLKDIFIKAGADDAGFVEVGRPGMEDFRDIIDERSVL